MAERSERMEARLLSSVRPTKAQEERFLAFLRKKYGPDAALSWQQSDAYPNGFRLEAGAEVYDWSAEGRLSQFKSALEQLAAAQGDVIPLLKETVLSWTPQAMAQVQPQRAAGRGGCHVHGHKRHLRDGSDRAGYLDAVHRVRAGGDPAADPGGRPGAGDAD